MDSVPIEWDPRIWLLRHFTHLRLPDARLLFGHGRERDYAFYSLFHHSERPQNEDLLELACRLGAEARCAMDEPACQPRCDRAVRLATAVIDLCEPDVLPPDAAYLVYAVGRIAWLASAAAAAAAAVAAMKADDDDQCMAALDLYSDWLWSHMWASVIMSAERAESTGATAVANFREHCLDVRRRIPPPSMRYASYTGDSLPYANPRRLKYRSGRGPDFASTCEHMATHYIFALRPGPGPFGPPGLVVIRGTVSDRVSTQALCSFMATRYLVDARRRDGGATAAAAAAATESGEGEGGSAGRKRGRGASGLRLSRPCGVVNATRARNTGADADVPLWSQIGEDFARSVVRSPPALIVSPTMQQHQQPKVVSRGGPRNRGRTASAMVTVSCPADDFNSIHILSIRAAFLGRLDRVQPGDRRRASAETSSSSSSSSSSAGATRVRDVFSLHPAQYRVLSLAARYARPRTRDLGDYSAAHLAWAASVFSGPVLRTNSVLAHTFSDLSDSTVSAAYRWAFRTALDSGMLGAFSADGHRMAKFTRFTRRDGVHVHAEFARRSKALSASMFPPSAAPPQSDAGRDHPPPSQAHKVACLLRDLTTPLPFWEALCAWGGSRMAIPPTVGTAAYPRADLVRGVSEFVRNSAAAARMLHYCQDSCASLRLAGEHSPVVIRTFFAFFLRVFLMAAKCAAPDESALFEETGEVATCIARAMRSFAARQMDTIRAIRRRDVHRGVAPSPQMHQDGENGNEKRRKLAPAARHSTAKARRFKAMKWVRQMDAVLARFPVAADILLAVAEAFCRSSHVRVAEGVLPGGWTRAQEAQLSRFDKCPGPGSVLFCEECGIVRNLAHVSGPIRIFQRPGLLQASDGKGARAARTSRPRMAPNEVSGTEMGYKLVRTDFMAFFRDRRATMTDAYCNDGVHRGRPIPLQRIPARGAWISIGGASYAMCSACMHIIKQPLSGLSAGTPYPRYAENGLICSACATLSDKLDRLARLP